MLSSSFCMLDPAMAELATQASNSVVSRIRSRSGHRAFRNREGPLSTLALFRCRLVNQSSHPGIRRAPWPQSGKSAVLRRCGHCAPFSQGRQPSMCVDRAIARGMTDLNETRRGGTTPRGNRGTPDDEEPHEVQWVDDGSGHAVQGRQARRGGVPAHVDWQIAEGTSGLVPVGTTGESPTLSHDEHQQRRRMAASTRRGAACR